ncbi:Tlg2-vesicle protein [Mucor velutinosus]|uniref:Tlg2-vesicle protein n=1 Tax=Mucor velutinosus TaxID=708070 RepID=A0AAN7HST5_9FUNG|nr:Tlg2-vesicle protein [Mucor velutinosus]
MEDQSGIALKNKPFMVDCVEWSQESRLAICVKNGVHIVTPVILGMLSTREKYNHVGISLPPLEKKVDETLIANVDLMETSYLLTEEGCRMAKWSPAGLSPNQSCFLAVITTKHRVLIYQISARDATNSDWQVYEDLTDRIKNHAITHQATTAPSPHHTLCASWSKSLIPDPFALQPVLFATSNKAGDVCMWAFTNTFEYKTQITPHASFVNLLEWTQWKKITDTTYIAYIVSACTDGTMAISSVRIQVSTVPESRTTQIQNVEMQVLHTWFEDNDSAVITLIKVHDELEKGVIKIAISKGIKVQVLCLNVKEDFTLEASKDWQVYILQASVLGLSSGNWVGDDNGMDLFRGYTSEGECVYLKIDSEGNMAYDNQMSIMWSRKMVQKYKRQWMEDQAKADDDSIVAASDALPTLFGTSDSPNSIFTALYYSLKANLDIHYKGDHYEIANLSFLLNRERGEDVDSICEMTATFIQDPYFMFTKPVRGLLREILYYLVDDADDEPMTQWISTVAKYLDVPPTIESINNLAARIYCETNTIAARIINNTQLELAEYKPPNFGPDYASTCQKAKQIVQAKYVNAVLSYANELPEQEFSTLNQQDVTLLLLLADLALSLRDEALIKQALITFVRIQDKFPQAGDLLSEIAFATSFTTSSAAIDKKARNKCPVCEANVYFIDGASNPLAQCEAGHFWEICSVTRTVLHSPTVRKCLSCKAKSLRPTEESTFTNVVLKGCCKCLYCGSGWINSS